ncbi:MAG: type III-A CRISPR-associated RAMP protein Csm3 [Tissierellia bacterium]|nr:type III-A CRISPR-associated RAMP protein Csm3 [Tissierellia bacterium]
MNYGKIEVSGRIEIITGLHIGGSKEFSAIGAVDSPVMKDSLTNKPMIPGSSLKGKLRYLIAQKYNPIGVQVHAEDDDRIIRLFGSPKQVEGAIRPSRVIFRDLFLEEEEEERIRALGVDGVTEVKFENTIHRFTCVANPRQIERVIRGLSFPFSIVYEFRNQQEILDDLKLLIEGFHLLECDYLGGHGSRGYGRIAFSEMSYDCVVGELSKDIEEELDKLIEVENGLQIVQNTV